MDLIMYQCISKAEQSSIASISDSRSLCRSYVTGQSMQTQLAIGVHNLPPLREVAFNVPKKFCSRFLVDCRISSLANVHEPSRQPLQAEHVDASLFAFCCVLFSLSTAVHATAILSALHPWQTTTFELPWDLHLLPQKAQMSDPKYEDIIELDMDLD